MSFDPALPTIRDQIRSDVGDTSGDPATEVLIDETYDAYLDLHPNWKRAAARIATAMLNKLDQDIKSYTAVGDFSVTYRDRKALELLRDQWNAEADAEAENETYGSVLTVTDRFLTGSRMEGGATW